MKNMTRFVLLGILPVLVFMSAPLTAQAAQQKREMMDAAPAGMAQSTIPAAQQQPVSSGAIKADSKNTRVKRMLGRDRKALKFFDKEGKQIKEISLVGKKTKIRISKDKPFSSKGFEIKISTNVEAAIEEMRKSSGRDINFGRSETITAAFSPNKKFVYTYYRYIEGINFADASDSEISDEPIDYGGITTVYDLEGNGIVEMRNDEGIWPIISNTGQFFVVVNGDDTAQRIINRRKEILAEVPRYSGKTLFSDNDRFIIMADKNWLDPDNWAISVFDTQNNKLEMRKLVVPDSVLSYVEKTEISESKRELTIYHYVPEVNKDKAIERVSF